MSPPAFFPARCKSWRPSRKWRRKSSISKNRRRAGLRARILRLHHRHQRAPRGGRCARRAAAICTNCSRRAAASSSWMWPRRSSGPRRSSASPAAGGASPIAICGPSIRCSAARNGKQLLREAGFGETDIAARPDRAARRRPDRPPRPQGLDDAPRGRSRRRRSCRRKNRGSFSRMRPASARRWLRDCAPPAPVAGSSGAATDFRGAEAETFTLRAEAPEDWQQLFRACAGDAAPERIVYLWNLDARVR